MAGANEPVWPAKLQEGQEEQVAVRTRNSVVFYRDPMEVSAGFALALDAIEAHANLLMANGDASRQKANPDCRRDFTTTRRKKRPVST
jgi:hypothetical protein